MATFFSRWQHCSKMTAFLSHDDSLTRWQFEEDLGSLKLQILPQFFFPLHSDVLNDGAAGCIYVIYRAFCHFMPSNIHYVSAELRSYGSCPQEIVLSLPRMFYEGSFIIKGHVSKVIPSSVFSFFYLFFLVLSWKKREREEWMGPNQ